MPDLLPNPHPEQQLQGKARPVPARPRWLLAIPDGSRQLEELDRELLTRRDIEQPVRGLAGAGGAV